MQLTMDDFKDIPKVQKEELTYSEPYIYRGKNVSYTIEKLSLEEFRAYFEELKKAGFTKISECEKGLHDVYYTAIFKKDVRTVLLMYIVPFARMYVNMNRNPYEVKGDSKKLFEGIPCFLKQETAFEDPADYGAGNYVVTLEGVEKKQYVSYLGELEKSGFEKYADNGEGLQGAVFSATYTKKKLVVTVTYLKAIKRMQISACINLPLSPYLLHDAQKVQCQKGAKTKLHMVDVDAGGNSFVWQLKNGHFVISDGGHVGDTEHLLDYLCALVPKGEKPVVDAWFISHGHVDHTGALEGIAAHPEYADRIYVEGVYYNEPNELVFALDPYVSSGCIIHMKDAIKILKATTGKAPELYRPQTGQRYYFCDMCVDIVLGQEQLPYENYSGDFNDSSTWCMFHVEGQKALFGGDGDKGGFRMMMDIYDKCYFEVELFSLLHHGHNTRDFITDYCVVQTVLDTGFTDELPSYRAKENAHLRDVTKEWISKRDGAKVLTFPYEIETYHNQRNPILPLDVHIPDGEAHVMPNGRLYVYGSYDNMADQYCSEQYLVVSTEDMEHWKIHDISFDGKDVPWFYDPSAPKYVGIDKNNLSPFMLKLKAEKEAKRTVQSSKEVEDSKESEKTKKKPALLYAPDAIHKDGKYYLYFCMSDNSEGVAVSDRPEGPFTNPVQLPCGGIDPAIFIDDDGQAYYYWGQLYARGVKLNPDMISFDEKNIVTHIVTEEEHFFHEGASVRKIGDTYYMVYSNMERGKPTALGYATSKSPLGPFTYRGIIVDNDGCDPSSWNNHGSIEEIDGQWYIFYHRSSRNSKRYRRMCIEPITINPDGSIDEVPITSQGIGLPFGPGEIIYGYQACILSGSAYIDLDGKGSEWITHISDGDSAVFRYVEADAGFQYVQIEAEGSGNIEVYLDEEQVATVEVVDGKSRETDFEKPVIGKHELRLKFRETKDLNVISVTLR